MNKISFPVSRFKPEYLQHIWDRIALFRTKKDERLLQDFDLFSEENIEQISEIEIELNRRFSNRFQLGKYLVELIDESDFIGREINQPYMWSWLSCVYLEQLTKNFSKVSRMEHYIPIIGDYKKKLGWQPIAHRHSVREPYRLYKQYRDSAKIYFSKNIHQQGNIIESIRSRQDCVSNKEIHEYLVMKYAMPDGFAKAGTATVPKPDKGTGRDSTVRLGKLFKRLAVTFHAPELKASELSNYLGPGFELENQ
ncbi:hypothetical protein [Synechococcus sp. M16.1]|uniref:hypothetical protein n=1 Tax=Synechococcus sp. M16.1 TaxID=1442553 RepID=UPI001644CD0E|nr:hypothetical protein [Synechococcus sp. M16.1]QNJ11002.1 hypothetical protein SynM161_00872 [Synechococcus sp. M16.1]